MIFSQIWPWLLVHFIYLIFLVSLLVYLLIILTNVWLQVILFLVMAPLLIILLTSWLLLLHCSNTIREGDKARSLVGPSIPTQLMTLYAPEPPVWLPVSAGPGRSRRARSESVCLSDKFAKSVSAAGQHKAISNVHTSHLTSMLEIERADRTKQNSGSLKGKPGAERRRIRSGCSSLSEKYSPKLSRSYNNDHQQDLIVELPNNTDPSQ